MSKISQGQIGISRRGAIMSGGALAVGSFLGAAPVRSAEPKRGGTLRMGIAGGGPSDTLNPGKLIETGTNIVSFQSRNNLVELLPNLQLGPELAVSWEPSPDATVWTFELRKGVEFHNGKTFDAEDVLYSINFHRGPNNSSLAAGLLRPIKDVKADGKSRVIFTLNGPDADFPFVLTEYRVAMMPAGTTDFNAAIGTGGYVLKSYDPGVRAFATRNKNYFRSDRAFFDEIETVTINDANARTNALLSGRVDFISRLDLRTVGLLKGQPRFAVRNDASFKHFSLNVLADVPPYDNNDVRLALRLALDRQELVDKILLGFGTVGNDSPFTPQHRYFNTDLPQMRYDPDRAKFHFAKAGLSDQVFELHVSEAAFEGAVSAVVLYQAAAAKAGLKIKITREPVDGYFTRVLRKVPFCTSYSFSRATIDGTYLNRKANNSTRWQHDRFDKICEAARGELDDNKRRDMYFETQKIMWDDATIFVPIWMNNVSASVARLKSLDQVSPANEMDGLRGTERWWFA